MSVLHALERFFLMDFHTQVPFLISRLDNDIHRLYHQGTQRWSESITNQSISHLKCITLIREVTSTAQAKLASRPG